MIPYTRLPNLGDTGRGRTGIIQPSIANLQTSFAFRTFRQLTVQEAIEEATSESVLGGTRGLESIQTHVRAVSELHSCGMRSL
jgi:hypothetical protein